MSVELIFLAFSAAVLFIVFFSLKPIWGVYALLFASVSTALYVDVGPFTIRPEQLVTALLAVIVFFFLLSGKRRPVFTVLDWLILTYLLLNVLSSVLHAPDLKTSLQRCLLLSVTLSSYFITTQLISTKKNASRLVALLIGIGIVEAIYGIVSVYLFNSGIDIGGAHAPYGDTYARGTFLEGNIFGSFQMIISLILTSFFFSDHFKKWRALLLIALIVVLLSSVMSFTRAAWLGFLAGGFCYLFFIRRSLFARTLKHLPLVVIAIVLLGAFGYLLSVSIHKGSVTLLDLYTQRFQNLLNSQSPYSSASFRVQVWKNSIDFWRRNPVLGNGTDSIKVLAIGTDTPKFGSDYWIPSSLIMALHDTGLVGLACFCAIQIVFLRQLYVSIRSTKDPFMQATLEGFFAGFIGVQIAYFFTNAFWLIFIWVFMSIGIACCRFSMIPPEEAVA